jgi:hypothetical protein
MDTIKPLVDTSESAGAKTSVETGLPKASEPQPPAPHPAWDFSARTFPWILALLALLYFHKELTSLAVNISDRVEFGNLAWPTSAVCFGPPLGTLMLRVFGSAGA